MAQNSKILEWSETWKFWNGPEYKNSGRVQNIKILERSRTKNSGMVHNSKILEWCNIQKFWNGPEFKNSGMVQI
jgi:hypothetical protein